MHDEIAVAVRRGGLVLTDGGVETRVMFDDTVPMDPVLGSASLLDTPPGRAALTDIFGDYLEVARTFAIPSVLGTPTFRASTRWISAASGHKVAELNARAVAFQQGVRAEFGAGDQPVWIAGVLGPAGDAYQPEQAPGTSEARAYHRPQAQALADAGADFLYAATFCSVDESIGVAQAMAETGSTAVISFVLGPDARVLDGTPLDVAFRRVDDVSPPAWFALSCVHPDVAQRAVDALGSELDRLREVKANASALSPDQLVTLDHVDTGDPEAWATSMARLGREAGIPVLGGCCGTDGRHLRTLAGLLTW
ncbi:MAG TPA: homocysteine S-methyltransferase family protein [Acidimicrobiales bacterium]|jgi:homocysteine S-methyltransferase|nr:homocysteine S-methyltransferase family protein [Acidimicrobiales bacterium]